jgi:nucleoside-diphosphate-sugar epimerase
MKVLVMGGTQFNGRALVKELVRQGHDVTVLNRGQTPAKLPAGVKRLTADRTDHAAVREALGTLEFDCVQDMTAYRLEDVELMSELLRGRTGHYIFASSTVIYAASDVLPITEDFPLDRGEGQNEYGRNKIACEEHLVRAHREHGFPASVAAFSMVFGPHNILPDREQRMFARLLRGRKILIPGNGRALSQIGHVEDEARALVAMMGRPVTLGKRYNLTGADAFSDEGYVDVFADVVGVEPDKIFVPAALMDDLYAGNLAVGAGPIQANIDTRGSNPGPSREVMRAISLFQLSLLVQKLALHIHRWDASVLFSVARLERDIGWRPQYTFRSAVEQTWEWFCAEGLDRKAEFDFSYEDQLLELIDSRS